jgi:hypothetical protein
MRDDLRVIPPFYSERWLGASLHDHYEYFFRDHYEYIWHY